jgi:hypothetical protein
MNVLTGKQGDKHQSFLAHVRENICAGDPAHLEYLLNWMALAVQQPNALGQIAIVLQGARGTGKSLFANTFGALFGRRYLAVTDSRRLAGSNSILQDCAVLFCDEDQPLYKWHERLIKGLLIEEDRVIERMGVDAQIVPNHVHLILTSNAPWMANSGYGRRFLVLDVIANHGGDTAYFGTIDADLKAGGLSNLLHALQARDVSSFDVFALPKHDEKATVMSYARKVKAHGELACAVDIAAAISAIDVSLAAASVGDTGSADSALKKARGLLAALIIDPVQEGP